MSCHQVGALLSPTICVIVPTYNNRGSIGQVLEDILAITSHVLVVDDGSDDGTKEILAGFNGLQVITHVSNLGKGAALLTGLHAAAESGYTHAVSMDGDGQHQAADLPAFIREIQSFPEAFIIGCRQLKSQGRPLKSRILRAHSNFWVWLLTGRWVRDSQSGFRAYPLARITALELVTKKYDFEVEVLVKALWTGLAVREVPITVSYGPGIMSHFRPIRDFMLVFRLITVLLLRRLVAAPDLLKSRCLQGCRQESKGCGAISTPTKPDGGGDV